MIMNELFWEPEKVINSTDRIDDFFTFFNFNEKEYRVVFKGKKRKLNKVVEYIDGIECIDEFPEEIKDKTDSSFFQLKTGESFLIVKRKALDPYAAAEDAVNLIETNMAVYRLYDHTYRYRIQSAKCGVFYDNYFCKVKREVRPLEHTKLPSVKRISESMAVVDNAIKKIVEDESYRDFIAIINAIKYHSQ